MPPPPWKWQPEQLYALNSISPSDTAYALLSYGLRTGSGALDWPGCNWLSATLLSAVADGGTGVKSRCSRLHPASSRAVPRANVMMLAIRCITASVYACDVLHVVQPRHSI